jgi:ABC-type nitrate/sulfonate/bicarbonate transport system substrate-binding protein
MSRARRALFPVAVVAAVLLPACGGDDDAATPTAPTASGSTGLGVGGVTADGISPERCAANRAAGTITYLSGFDFAATASIVEVIVADAKGYFDEMCLDVELTSSFSTDNYPLIAANRAQFSSGGSFSEVVRYADSNDADFVVVAVEGKTGIDALVTQPEITELAQLEGQKIGVKGAITQSVKAMLAEAGMVEGEDYSTVSLEGFDPKVHIAQPVAGFPVFKSNEPGQLERAGVPYTLFDPAESGIPGSFGILYTNRAFLDEHPTAAQDFVRAAMKGMEDAIADPDEAAAICVERINGGGNPRFLSPEGETFRWHTEAELVVSSTPPGQPLGLPDEELLRAEVEAYTEAGSFETVPDISGRFDAELLAGVYDESGRVVWPAS